MAVNISIEKYEPFKIEQIKKNLESQSTLGSPLYYEIFVDNMKVVYKTNNVEQFDAHEEFINEDTKKIRILIYSTNPNAPRNTKHIFFLKENAEENGMGLNGVEIDKKITEQVSRERERWDCDQVRKDLVSTKEKLKEAQDYIETLQNAVEQYKGKKLHWGDVNLGEFASVVLEGIVRRNPQMLAKLPGGVALAGVIELDNKEREQTISTVQHTEEASFKRKEENTSADLTEQDKNYLRVVKQMEEHFDQTQLMKVMQIIDKLAQDTSNINPVAELLNINPDSQKTNNTNEKV
jgi:hypothetical protein